MRESAIERRGRDELEKAGYMTEKLGVRGLPDNIVIYHPCAHFFIEWKQPGGRLTALQKRRIPKLRNRGEWVAILDRWQDAVPVAKSAHRHSFGKGELHCMFYAPAAFS